MQALGKALEITGDEATAKLKDRLQEHKESTIDYREPLRARGLEVSDAWRGLGAAESSVDRFKLRTAKRGRSWSKKGLEAILNMLGMLYEGLLKDALASLDTTLFTKPETEEIIAVSANQIAKKVGAGVLNVRKGGFPALNAGTQGYAKLFRQMLHLQTI